MWNEHARPFGQLESNLFYFFKIKINHKENQLESFLRNTSDGAESIVNPLRNARYKSINSISFANSLIIIIIINHRRRRENYRRAARAQHGRQRADEEGCSTQRDRIDATRRRRCCFASRQQFDIVVIVFVVFVVVVWLFIDCFMSINRITSTTSSQQCQSFFIFIINVCDIKQFLKWNYYFEVRNELWRELSSLCASMLDRDRFAVC